MNRALFLNVEDTAGNNTGQVSACRLCQVAVGAMKRNEAVERDRGPGTWGKKRMFLYT